MENIKEMFLGTKLVSIRKELQERDIKKSGFNKFADFHYFELGDILPHIKELQVKYNIMNKIDFKSDKAVLTIINNDNPAQEFVFESTIAETKVKGCNDIQNLGATQTYLRRYLYCNAYEISDQDVLDKTTGVKEAKERALQIYNLGGQLGYSIDQVNAQIKKKFDCNINVLAEPYANQVIAGYKNALDKKNIGQAQ